MFIGKLNMKSWTWKHWLTFPRSLLAYIKIRRERILWLKPGHWQQCDHFHTCSKACGKDCRDVASNDFPSPKDPSVHLRHPDTPNWKCHHTHVRIKLHTGTCTGPPWITRAIKFSQSVYKNSSSVHFHVPTMRIWQIEGKNADSSSTSKSKNNPH